MATKHFADAWRRDQLRNPPTERTTYHDTASALSARIGPGGISWVVWYRVKGAGKQVAWTFGSYPAIRLQAARARLVSAAGDVGATRILLRRISRSLAHQRSSS